MIISLPVKSLRRVCRDNPYDELFFPGILCNSTSPNPARSGFGMESEVGAVRATFCRSGLPVSGGIQPAFGPVILLTFHPGVLI
jgi:hypothetical protein